MSGLKYSWAPPILPSNNIYRCNNLVWKYLGVSFFFPRQIQNSFLSSLSSQLRPLPPTSYHAKHRSPGFTIQSTNHISGCLSSYQPLCHCRMYTSLKGHKSKSNRRISCSSPVSCIDIRPSTWYIKYHCLLGLLLKKNCLSNNSHSSDMRSPRLRWQPIPPVVRSGSLSGLQKATFFKCPHMSLFLRSWSSMLRTSSEHCYPSKAPPPNTITLG